MSLDVLNQRRSVPSRQLGEPGPSDAQLRELLTAAIRVPDHGKLTPWRLVTIRGASRAKLGTALAEMHLRHEPDVPPSVIEKDRNRFGYAPLIVAVVARIEEDHAKVPAQEQLLSAGLVAYNLLLGAQALGFGAQWLTGWAAYDPMVLRLLGLDDDEKIAGFIHIGTPLIDVPERDRPDPRDLLSDWSPA